MKIKHHWLEGVERVPTKKMSPGKIVPKFIVYHYTAGISERGDLHTLAKSNRSVSCQLMIKRDGSIIQMGPFDRRMWHAGPSRAHGYKDLNSHSIGIEICNAGFFRQTDKGYQHWTGKLYPADEPIVDPVSGKAIGKSTPPSDWLHEKHPVVGSSMNAWEPYTDGQLAALDEITEALCEQYPSIKWGVSHEEIDMRGWKSDPGPAFPLRRYTKIIEDRSDPDAEHDSETTVWRSIVNLNVRSSPQMGDNIIKVLTPMEPVSVLESHRGWLLIASGGDITGWVYSKYMERFD